MQRPKASVVIPCYNAEQYLPAALDSALAQTMEDLEVVCVDNNSTDGTAQILQRYAERDERVRVLSESEAGEGPARDAGLKAARGEWLYFLDADDLMCPSLLERAIARAEEASADMVVFRTISLNAVTHEEKLVDYSWRTDWLAEGQTTFSPREQPDRVFSSFQNWVHNKLFRGAFVREHNLGFQHVHRSADILFTCHALSLAQTVALLDEPLHKYRINNPSSAMATSDSYPLDFAEGFLALREALEADETWGLFRTSFENWAIESIVANLRTTRSLQGYETILGWLRKGGLDRLGVTGFPVELAENPELWQDVRDLTSKGETQLLFDEWSHLKGEMVGEQTHTSGLHNDVTRLNNEIAERDSRIRELEDELERLRSSKRFRMGSALARLARRQ